MIGRLLEMLRPAARKAAPPPSPTPAPPAAPTLDAAAVAAGRSVAEWLRRRRDSRLLYSTISTEAAAALQRRYPDRAAATLRAAECILRHEFDMLGSGPYVPVDPDRPAQDGYRPIDWFLDPVRSERYARSFPYKQWNLWEMQPGNADIKYPWELGRCQHWVPLAQAFRLTGDDRFATEIAREAVDFLAANPVGVGVNWSCTMDVGIRAANWAIAFELVNASAALDEPFWLDAYRALYTHGVFVRNNLENNYEVTSNHYLSNLLGLVFLGRLFADLAEGDEWNTFWRTSIEEEINVQVLDDGADYESSIPYHRLVTELFLGAARLSDAAGAPLSQTYRTRLHRMVSFLATVTRPDGLMPQVGDADDGRLHIFDGYATKTPQDARHLFGPAGIMFDEPQWRALGGAAGEWEAAWWGLDAAPSHSAQLVAPITKLFPDAGVAVARTEAGHYLLVTNGAVGTSGFGNHKHNDLLSFEYHHGGTPLVVDPGSYVYTSDVAGRNQFRGTGYHNTLMLDRVEQNELRPVALWLFRMFDKSRPETVSFHDGAEVVEYVGQHHGYERLLDAVTHRRTFRLKRASGELAIVDDVIGSGQHELCWHFHLAPDVSAQSMAGNQVALTAGGRRWVLSVPADLAIAIRPVEYSPSYGVKLPCMAVDVTTVARLAGQKQWQFSIAP